MVEVEVSDLQCQLVIQSEKWKCLLFNQFTIITSQLPMKYELENLFIKNCLVTNLSKVTVNNSVPKLSLVKLNTSLCC